MDFEVSFEVWSHHVFLFFFFFHLKFSIVISHFIFMFRIRESLQDVLPRISMFMRDPLQEPSEFQLHRHLMKSQFNVTTHVWMGCYKTLQFLATGHRKLPVLWQAFNISFFRSSRLVKALLLSSAGKLLVIPVVIWGETHIYTTLLLTRLFMAVASTQAITGRCIDAVGIAKGRGGHMSPLPHQMAGNRKRKRRKKGR